MLDALGEASVQGIAVDVLEVLELPSLSRSGLVFSHLPLLVLERRTRMGVSFRAPINTLDMMMTHLDPALLPGSGIVIPSSDPVSHLGPQPPALPLSLLLDRLDRDLVLGNGRVGKHLVRLGDLADPSPGSFVWSDGLAVVRQDGLVRVSLTRDPAWDEEEGVR
jgi:hypothetical protein